MKASLALSSFAAFIYLFMKLVITICYMVSADEALAEISGTPNLTPGQVGFMSCIVLITIAFMSITLYRASDRDELRSICYLLIAAGMIMLFEFAWTVWQFVSNGFGFFVSDNIGASIALGFLELFLALYVFTVASVAAIRVGN